MSFSIVVKKVGGNLYLGRGYGLREPPRVVERVPTLPAGVTAFTAELQAMTEGGGPHATA